MKVKPKRWHIGAALLMAAVAVVPGVAGASQGAAFLGHSVVASPYGTALAGPAPADHEGVYLATADLDQVAQAGQRATLITPAQDRRRDLYSVTYLGRNL